MNWLVIAVVGAAAAWFEFNYQRSRHQQKKAAANHPPNSSANSPVAATANVENPGEASSLSSATENGTKLDTSA
jgi:cytoskeletal protein RodZ